MSCRHCLAPEEAGSRHLSREFYVFPLFHIFPGPKMGSQGEPWSFTHQTLLLWKSYVNHGNTACDSEIVRRRLEDE